MIDLKIFIDKIHQFDTLKTLWKNSNFFIEKNDHIFLFKKNDHIFVFKKMITLDSIAPHLLASLNWETLQWQFINYQATFLSRSFGMTTDV